MQISSTSCAPTPDACVVSQQAGSRPRARLLSSPLKSAFAIKDLLQEAAGATQVKSWFKAGFHSYQVRVISEHSSFISESNSENNTRKNKILTCMWGGGDKIEVLGGLRISICQDMLFHKYKAQEISSHSCHQLHHTNLPKLPGDTDCL